jgi:NTP pyrophosphatase (non-canonical NTP hydrolase)
VSEQPQPQPEGSEPQPQPPSPTEAVSVDPQRLIRIASVTREVLEEARRIRPEAGAVDHLKRLHEKIHDELKEALPPELFEEFDELTPDIKEGSLEELALAHAEILGWLEGLFQGTQIAMQLQAMRAFQDAQRKALAEGTPPPEGPEIPGARGRDPRYL